MPAHAARAAATTLTVILASAITAGAVLTAGNTVPTSKTGRFVTTITANKLKPAACSTITLSTRVNGNTGTSGADLLLGSAAADTMVGNGGNDCILGGGGDDSIDGGTETDVCIGGPGTDTFVNCETQIQ